MWFLIHAGIQVNSRYQKGSLMYVMAWRFQQGQTFNFIAAIDPTQNTVLQMTIRELTLLLSFCFPDPNYIG